MVGARLAILCAAVLFGTCLCTGTSRADPKRDQAYKLAVEATKLARAGQRRQAIDKFKQAERLFPRPDHVCNIGIVYAELKAWPQALRFLTLCRTRWPKDGKRRLPAWVDAGTKKASSQLQSGKFVAVRFTSVPTGATLWVAGYPADETITTPGTVWLPFGTHVVHASRAGYEPYKQQVTVGAGASDSVAVALTKMRVAGPTPQPTPQPKPQAKPKKATSSPTPTPTPTPPQLQPGPDPDKPQRRARRSAWPSMVVTGIGAALIVNGAAFHAVALGTKRDAQELRPGADFDRELRTFRKQKYTAVASYAAGAVLTGVGVYLLHRVRRHNVESRVRLGADTAAGGGMVWVRWDH